MCADWMRNTRGRTLRKTEEQVYSLSEEHMMSTPSLSSRWCLSMIIALLFNTSMSLPKQSPS
ncbi:hypothetical protein ACQJBY_072877 [Aegilops geniculata]